MITIKIQYFANLRESRGLNEEEITTSFTNAADIYEDLNGSYSFGLNLNDLRVAINDEFAEWQALLKTGDTITFIPPVSGG